MDKSVLDIVLQTCSKTEIPPKPSIKDAIMILIDSFFSGILQITLKPLVSSIIPETNPNINVFGICNKSNKGSIKLHNTLNKLLVCRIEIITENRTTNPPINKIVLIEFVMLFPIIAPKFDKLILSLFFALLV